MSRETTEDEGYSIDTPRSEAPGSYLPATAWCIEKSCEEPIAVGGRCEEHALEEGKDVRELLERDEWEQNSVRANEIHPIVYIGTLGLVGAVLVVYSSNPYGVFMGTVAYLAGIAIAIYQTEKEWWSA